MKSSKLIAMAGAILISTISLPNTGCSYANNLTIQTINNYEEGTRNNQPQERGSRYPERFPASLRGYDFRLSPKKAIRTQD